MLKRLSEKSRFILATGMIVSGIVLVYIAFFTPPVGEVHGSILGFFGEIITASGAILGIDIAVDKKINKRLKNDEKMD